MFHRKIELYETEKTMGYSQEFKNYLKLKQKHQFQPVENGMLIYIEIDDKPVCAGRLDMIIISKDYLGFGMDDVKRTYNVHLEHLKFLTKCVIFGNPFAKFKTT